MVIYIKESTNGRLDMDGHLSDLAFTSVGILNVDPDPDCVYCGSLRFHKE